MILRHLRALPNVPSPRNASIYKKLINQNDALAYPVIANVGSNLILEMASIARVAARWRIITALWVIRIGTLIISPLWRAVTVRAFLMRWAWGSLLIRRLVTWNMLLRPVVMRWWVVVLGDLVTLVMFELRLSKESIFSVSVVVLLLISIAYFFVSISWPWTLDVTGFLLKMLYS